MYDIFGGIKKQWPDVRTVAVLDWEEFPADLPLNVWVDEYADYGASPSYKIPTAKEALRQKWLASGAGSKTGPHSFWYGAYSCILCRSMYAPLTRFDVFVAFVARTSVLLYTPRWYWCIGPADPAAMNTFVERPAIEARLLYWLTALHAVNGMLCA